MDGELGIEDNRQALLTVAARLAAFGHTICDAGQGSGHEEATEHILTKCTIPTTTFSSSLSSAMPSRLARIGTTTSINFMPTMANGSATTPRQNPGAIMRA